MAEVRLFRDGVRMAPEEERRYLKEKGLWPLKYAMGPRRLSEMRPPPTPDEARAMLDKFNREWAAMGGLLGSLGSSGGVGDHG